jgi:hypothetical protein
MLTWKPNDGPQTLFLEAVASGDFYEIGYGGARGGGKTDGGIMSLLYDKDHELYRALVIRKNADDLKDWGDRASRWYESQGADRTGNPPEFSFPKGGKVRTGHLKDENAFSKYQGHEYHKMLIEELTQIPSEENYLKLAASCRSTIPELRPCIISTFNPDGPGFAWVRKRFNIVGIPTKPIITVDPVTGLKRIFIPARLEDNPSLSKDPTYRAFLNGLPDGLREAWRDGSWEDPVIKGAYYTKEILQARKAGRIKIFPHDPMLKVHTVWDLGYDDSMSIGFFQRISGEIRIIAYYQNSNYGMPHYVTRLRELQIERGYNYGKHFAPHDASKHELGTGLTVVQSAKKLGLEFQPVPKVSIDAGIEKVRLMWTRFWINEPECEQALSAWRNYRKVWDDKLLKYKDEPLHDWASHGADMLRYASLVEDQMTNEGEPVEDNRPVQHVRDSRYEGTIPVRQPEDELTDEELARM